MKNSNFGARDILINVTPFQKKIVVRHKKQISEVFYQQPSDTVLLDSIYKGIVLSIIPSLNAAFVEIGAERAGFLHIDDIVSAEANLSEELESENTQEGLKKSVEVPKQNIKELLKEGQEVLVQVKKEAINTKGARLSMNISLLGRFLIGIPNSDFIGVSKKNRSFEKRREMIKILKRNKPDNIGLIVRTLGIDKDEKEIKKQIQILSDRWQFCQERLFQMDEPGLLYQNSNLVETTLRDCFSDDVEKVIIDDKQEYRSTIDYLKILSPEKLSRVELYQQKQPIFDYYGIEEELAKIFQREIHLKGGGSLVIEQTEALVSIDVNTGGRVKVTNQAKNNLETNMVAAYEIAKQMRLRDLGGILIIDFIDMTDAEDMRTLEESFAKAITQDRAPVHFTGISEIGVMEVTRKRVRSNLVTNQSKVCPTCQGNSYIPNVDNLLSNIDRGLHQICIQKKCSKLILAVHFKICDILVGQRGSVLKYWERRFKVQIDLYEDEAIEYPNFRIFNAETQEELTQKYSWYVSKLVKD